MAGKTEWYGDPEQLVDQIVAAVGRDIRIGLPLGLGKPVELVNALYRRAVANPDIQLTMLTALSLERPKESEPLRKRFLEPVFQRVFEGCPELEYSRDLSGDGLPDNIVVKEFYFRPGSRLSNQRAQADYVSSNYTHAARDAFANGCNVVMQMVARGKDEQGNTRLSMSCNPDTSPELAAMLRESSRPHLVIAAVNQNLPYMFGDADVPADHYDLIYDNPEHYSALFPLPKLLPVGTAEYLIGLRASALVRDGGTLQLGIGAMSDAIVHALCLRQRDSASYREALQQTGVLPQAQELIEELGGTGSFREGLYGATEMFVEGFMALLEAGILKRQVYDFWALQSLINDGRCDPERLDASVLENMADLGVREIRTRDFLTLQHHGLFTEETQYERGRLIAPDGSVVLANLADPESRQVIADKCLGQRLRNGHVIHGGFFLGSRQFYQALRDMPEDRRRRINMSSVYKINQLDHNPRLYNAQRKHARFINTGMVATLMGAVASDTLDSGKVISGVGGQYNFVAMAHHLKGGRSILMIRAVREKDGQPVSNVVWQYGACTIPRHLRDIVVTEYGIADLRSRSDAEVIQALLNIADSRFQQDLLRQAKAAGKVASSYQIPERFCDNTPESLQQKFSEASLSELFPPFPFGTDFTEQEIILAKALKGMAARRESGVVNSLLPALKRQEVSADMEPYLERMGLKNPAGFRDKIVRKLLAAELRHVVKD